MSDIDAILQSKQHKDVKKEKPAKAEVRKDYMLLSLAQVIEQHERIVEEMSPKTCDELLAELLDS